MTGDQKNGVGIETGSLVGTVNLVIVVNEGETMIVGAEIMIGIMIEIVDMIETVTETQTAPAPMTQEVVGGHALDPESDLEIMIDIGVMIDTSNCHESHGFEKMSSLGGC